MKRILILPALSLLLSHAFGDSGIQKEKRRWNLTADLTYNSNSIETKSTDLTLAAKTSTSFTALELGTDYFFHPRIAVTAQVLFQLISSVDGEIKGFDFGARYYPTKNGFQSEVELLGSKIVSTPGWLGYFYGGFSSREYQISNASMSFNGIETGGGMDYHYADHLFLRGSLNYQMLHSGSIRTLQGFVAAIGCGYSF